LRLAELLAAGPEESLGRAEDLDNERLWIALFLVHERTGSTVASAALPDCKDRARHHIDPDERARQNSRSSRAAVRRVKRVCL
jgi:hypothetical protein